MIRRIACFIALLALLTTATAAQTLAPFKDDLFAYPATLSEADGGAYRVVDYREQRDVNGRDEVPERRVRKEYVSLGVRSQQKEMKLESPVGPLRFVAVGKQENASMIVLYLHGQGGSRVQGVNDFTFGGNFNRVKNLVAKAGGLYLSPDFKDFGDGGASQVREIILHFSQLSPKAPVIVACGSMGGMLCWKLASDPEVASRLGGLLLLGSLWDDSFFNSPAYKRKVPVFFGHGSRDTVFAVEKQEAFYRKLRGKSGAYPTRFVRFESGTHGTPIRMSDWRGVLDWMINN
ncbi:MAG: alpha/beta hydrolase [Rhizobiaceae bacterium]|nr:alpha/beta hydrolase [Rhizobiaceae bacterium]